MAWTEDRIEVLRKLWGSGHSASQIAKELGEGVTRNAVIGKAHRLGLEKRPSPVKSDKAKKPAKPKSAPVAAAPKPEKQVSSKSVVTLLDLTDRMCKWPIGHPGDDDFRFCGKNAQPGMPYCGKHCLEAYQAQPPRRDRQRARPVR